ncbi:hypothetical protein V7S43_005827 [Phytophthora oleae]|uniref:Elicitin n=1 Tax=Phytophthora oleae TaxID=2107226 RepID=A0ABD3FRW2_9STRA
MSSIKCLLVFFTLLSVAYSVPLCNNSQLLEALQPLKTQANYSSCQVDANAAAICASSACKSLMTPLAALNLPGCQISFKGVNFSSLALKAITPASCEASSKQRPSLFAMMRTILRLLKNN